ncbi:MAG: dockerin type I repeat-containing protein, partial [Planctomycetota bacterium]
GDCTPDGADPPGAGTCTAGPGSQAVRDAHGLLLVGHSGFSADSLGDVSVTCYRPNGDVETRFGDDGTTTVKFGEHGNSLTRILVHSGRRGFGEAVYLCGTRGSVGSRRLTVTKLQMGILNPGYGQPDPDFGIGGHLEVDVGHDGQQYMVDCGVLPDGRLVLLSGHLTDPVIGTAQREIVVAVLETDGEFSRSFSGDGKRYTSLGTRLGIVPTAMCVTRGGQIIVAGYEWANGNRRRFILRFTEEGEYDRDFGNGHQWVSERVMVPNDSDDILEIVEYEHDHYIVLTKERIFRMVNWVIDDEFHDERFGNALAPESPERVLTLADRFYVLGNESDRMSIYAFHYDGTPAAEWGTDGRRTVDFLPRDSENVSRGRSVLPHARGILVGGTTNSRQALALIDTTGAFVTEPIFCTVQPSDPAPENGWFQAGDPNASGTIDVSDAVAGLEFLFGGSPVSCEQAMDVNGDGSIDLSDPVALLGHLFLGQSPSGITGICEVDTLRDGSRCETSPACN